MSGPSRVFGDRAAGDVELHHGGRADGVAVAGLPADALVVDGGELDGPVGQQGLGDGAGRRIEHPAVHPGQAAGGRRGGGPGAARPEAVPHRDGVGGRVAGGVEDDPPAGVGGRVADVEHVGGVDVEPRHLAGPGERHEADPGAVRLVPAVGHALAQPVERERHGQVEEDGVPVGDREVVHHRRTGHRDLGARDELARRREPVVGEERRREPVAEEVQLTRHRVGLGVRGHRGGEAAVEVARADRGELGREHVREAALDQRHDPARVRDHMGVRDADGAVDRAVRLDHRLAQQRLRAHPTVAVPLGATIAQADAVHHAVPDEPVPRRLTGQRVGAVAQVAAGELGRERTVDREIDGVDLVRHRGEVPGHVDRCGGRHGRSMHVPSSTCQE